MPVNRNALIRYRTIDRCLGNRYRQWTLNDLIEACSEALYEYEGIDKGVSRRTVQMDLQMMRSDKLGYNAPIVVTDKKYYSYSDPDYSITKIPLSKQDLGTLSEAVELLKQFNGFQHFQELSGIVKKLENRIRSSEEPNRTVIDVEKNLQLKGLEFIDTVYRSIIDEKALWVEYQSFKAKEASRFLFFPALLKEYNNRWFVLGKREELEIFTLLALDRIVSLEQAAEACPPFDQKVVQNYFKDVVGVSVNEGAPTEEVVLYVQSSATPYVMTKPIHPSQKLLEQDRWGIKVSIEVKLNFELERSILGFGEEVTVLKPRKLHEKLKGKLRENLNRYLFESNRSKVDAFPELMAEHGFAVIDHLFKGKTIQLIGKKAAETLGRDFSGWHTFDNRQDKAHLLHRLYHKALDQITGGTPGYTLKHVFFWQSVGPQMQTHLGCLHPEAPQQVFPIHPMRSTKGIANEIWDRAFWMLLPLKPLSLGKGSYWQPLPKSHKAISPSFEAPVPSPSKLQKFEMDLGGAIFTKPKLMQRLVHENETPIRYLLLLFAPNPY